MRFFFHTTIFTTDEDGKRENIREQVQAKFVDELSKECIMRLPLFSFPMVILNEVVRFNRILIEF